jgi:MarR family transcriptional regulator for hemolysin
MEEHDFGILLGLAYQAFKAELHQVLDAAGFDDVKPSFGFVFRALDRGPCTASQLAALLDISSPGSTKIVGEMVAAGYVERVPDPADGRARPLHLTARGRTALATVRRFHADFERRLAGEHGTERVATVRAGLAGYLDQAGAEPELARSLRPL